MKRSLIFVFFIMMSILSAKEFYLSVPFKNIEQVKEINKISYVDRIKDGVIYLYANEKQIKNLRKNKVEMTILDNPSSFFNEKIAYNTTDLRDWDSYPSYETYINIMNEFADNYPGICHLLNIGSSVEGREILVLKISDNVIQDEAEPEFYYSGQIHGDEIVTGITLIHLIDELLIKYNSDEQITNLINNTEIYINPISNPDGVYAGGNDSMLNSTRTNANGVDLNRNYPDAFSDDLHPDGNEFQPETIIQMDFMNSHNFIMSSNLHSGAVVVNYPYDTKVELHKDTDWFELVCHQYANLAQEASNNGYFTQYDNGVTNGFVWYEVHGGRQDYFNVHNFCREITLELSEQKILPAELLGDYWNWNRNSLLAFIDQIHNGIKGYVYDENNNPIENAIIKIINHDDNVTCVKSGNLGEFYRPIFSGTYDVLIYKDENFLPFVINDLVVSNNQSVEISAVLSPVSLITVSGLVNNEQGEDIGVVNIFLSSNESGKIYSCFSDNLGNFVFDSISSGYYKIEVEKDNNKIYKSNILLNSNIYNMIITTNDYLFFDDFENGVDNWTVNGNWGVENINGNNFLSDSPNGNYGSNENFTTMISQSFNLSSFDNAECSFEISYDLENSYDYLYFEIKKNSEDWSILKSFTNLNTNENVEINLNNYLEEDIKFRFRLSTDLYTNKEGVLIDNFIIKANFNLVNNDLFFNDAYLEVSQNFPNPFYLNSQTNFEIYSNLRSKKKIEIYNVKGQLIYTINCLDRNKISWDGTIKGKKVSTGIYFYKVSDYKNSSKIKKMIIIK